MITGKTENGPLISGVDSWFQAAQPAGGSVQWKDYRSAKELARCWCRFGPTRFPEEMANLCSSNKILNGFKLEQGVAEMEIAFDNFQGGVRNADLAFWGANNAGKVLFTVEAKADESLGNTVGGALANVEDNPRSNVPARITQLSQALFGREPDDTILPLRYQLLHALAATAVLAKQKGAGHGVLVVHEFISLTLNFDKVEQNSADLKAYIRSIPGWENANLQTGHCLPFITLVGNAHVPDDVKVSIAKVRTLVPLGAGGRQCVIATGENAHQTLVI